ncbi:unnamed protein product [Caenorhabditis angaria]|uniref:Uncharacterized protein n=1 Tax=Caenorhabditis angaria TaxID=860376 RepID=A0A9P1ID06_9PELO|nr:unnamed protein product [Caenorhabditis angaria]
MANEDEEPSQEYVRWKKRLNGHISRVNSAKNEQKKIRENLLKLENSKKLQQRNEDSNAMESSNKEVAISGDSETIRTVFGESCSIRPQSRFGIDWAKWFPPVTSRTFLSHYLPASGAAFHIIYTIHLFSPNIISGLFSTSDLAVSNTILFTANVGLGFYVYFRRHLHRVNLWERLEFSVLTSTLFNFVSSRAAVSFKAIFPAKTQTWLKTLFATSLSVYLLSRAYRHLAILDAKSSRPSEANEVFTKEL